MTALPPDPPTDKNKAHGAAAGAGVGFMFGQVLVRLLNYLVPGFLDESTTIAVEGIADVLFAWYGAYIVPHKST